MSDVSLLCLCGLVARMPCQAFIINCPHARSAHPSPGTLTFAFFSILARIFVSVDLSGAAEGHTPQAMLWSGLLLGCPSLSLLLVSPKQVRALASRKFLLSHPPIPCTKPENLGRTQERAALEKPDEFVCFRVVPGWQSGGKFENKRAVQKKKSAALIETIPLPVRPPPCCQPLHASHLFLKILYTCLIVPLFRVFAQVVGFGKGRVRGVERRRIRKKKHI
jgi:hypothetical protein